MGNQQVTATDLELGWLAGIIDGEGYIGLNLEKQTRVNNERIVPQMHISNTDEAIILRARDIMRKIGVNPYIRTSGFVGKIKKDQYRLQIKRYKTLLKFLSVIAKHMTGSKRERAELVREFCELRLNAPTFKNPKARGGPIKPHTPRELEIYAICKPKQKRGTSETIRQAERSTSEIWKIVNTRQLGCSEDIVRPYART